MKHKPIFRLSLLALLLAGCGKDTTELPEGPGTPATGGDAIVCRLVDRQRSARHHGRNPHGLRPVTGRLLPDLLAQRRPGGDHLPADDPAMGGSRSQRLRGDRKRSRPEQHGDAVGEQSQLRFLRLLSGRRRADQQRLDRRDGNPGRTDLPQRRMQHAVRLYGGMHPRGGTRARRYPSDSAR